MTALQIRHGAPFKEFLLEGDFATEHGARTDRVTCLSDGAGELQGVIASIAGVASVAYAPASDR